MKANESIAERVAELQGRNAKQITDVRDAARQHTTAAVETMDRCNIVPALRKHKRTVTNGST